MVNETVQNTSTESFYQKSKIATLTEYYVKWFFFLLVFIDINFFFTNFLYALRNAKVVVVTN